MDKTEAQKTLNKLVRRLTFTATSTIETTDLAEGRIIIKTACNGLFFDKFEEHVYSLIESLEPQAWSNILNKFFQEEKYIGTIKRDKKSFDDRILDHIDLSGEVVDKSEPESLFIQTIYTALKSDQKTGDNSNVRLRWTGSARRLAWIIRRLTDDGYLEAPQLDNGEINCQELAKRVLGSFEVGSSLQNIRKSVDPDQSKLSFSGKEAMETIVNALKEFEQ